MYYDTYRTIIWAAIISLTLFVIGAITMLETWDARKEAWTRLRKQKEKK